MAQIKIRYPESRFVFQRNNNNQAEVPVVLQFDKPVQKIEIQAIARSMSTPQGTSTDWITVQKNSQSNTCYTKITLSGGWYDLVVRAFDGLTFIGIDTLKELELAKFLSLQGSQMPQEIMNLGIRTYLVLALPMTESKPSIILTGKALLMAPQNTRIL
jgi:hypothetical protein